MDFSVFGLKPVVGAGQLPPTVPTVTQTDVSSIPPTADVPKHTRKRSRSTEGPRRDLDDAASRSPPLTPFDVFEELVDADVSNVDEETRVEEDISRESNNQQDRPQFFNNISTASNADRHSSAALHSAAGDAVFWALDLSTESRDALLKHPCVRHAVHMVQRDSTASRFFAMYQKPCCALLLQKQCDVTRVAAFEGMAAQLSSTELLLLDGAQPRDKFLILLVFGSEEASFVRDLSSPHWPLFIALGGGRDSRAMQKVRDAVFSYLRSREKHAHVNKLAEPGVVRWSMRGVGADAALHRHYRNETLV